MIYLISINYKGLQSVDQAFCESYTCIILDKSIPQVAIRWLIQQDVVSSVIIGATSVKQLEDNMGASKGWKLSEEEVKPSTSRLSLVALP